MTDVPDDERETLLGVQRDADDDPGSEWCSSCQRNHQRREHPVQCGWPGCTTTTHSYHGLCPRHR